MGNAFHFSADHVHVSALISTRARNVARMERSGMREVCRPILPDYASLHPGYAGYFPVTVKLNNWRKNFVFNVKTDGLGWVWLALEHDRVPLDSRSHAGEYDG